MKNEKIANAFNEIDDTYLAQAAAPKKHRFPVWIGAIAAILALILTLSFFPGPQSDPTNPNLEAAPTGPAPTTRPSDPTNPANPDGPQKPLEGDAKLHFQHMAVTEHSKIHHPIDRRNDTSQHHSFQSPQQQPRRRKDHRQQRLDDTSPLNFLKFTCRHDQNGLLNPH